jgi:hypothetical protein
MTITESRLKDGTLTIGAVAGECDLSCQVTNARINSSYSDDGDPLETLCGDEIPAGRKLDQRALAGTFVQDWDAAATPGSITDYLWDHDLESVPFTYTPNVAGPTLTGTVRLEVPAESYGGDVNARITSDFEWAIIGEITRTPAAAALAASSSARETANA